MRCRLALEPNGTLPPTAADFSTKFVDFALNVVELPFDRTLRPKGRSAESAARRAHVRRHTAWESAGCEHVRTKSSVVAEWGSAESAWRMHAESSVGARRGVPRLR